MPGVIDVGTTVPAVIVAATVRGMGFGIVMLRSTVRCVLHCLFL